MVLDSSVLVALQIEEAGWRELLGKISAAPVVFVGAPTACEAAIVLTNRMGDSAGLLLDHAMRKMRVEVVPFTEEHYSAASSAFLRFGKGRHPAALNYGDCMSYAMATVSGLPLLYVGNDFSKTDVAAA